MGCRQDMAAVSGVPASDRGDSRERIVAAAVRVFARKGFQRASLDEIAADAGLTKGAIYWHFRSKNDLFFSLLERCFERNTAPLPADIARAVASAGPDNRREVMIALFRSVLRRFREDADWPRLLLEFLAQSRDAGIAARLRQLCEQGRLVARSAAEQLQQGGLIAPALDADMLAVFWGALLDGLMIAWLVQPETMADDRLISRMADMLASGMLPAERSVDQGD